MKVILLQNVPGLGQKDDVKEVKAGYWRNFLLPGKLVVEATPKAMEQAEKRKKMKEEEKVREKKQLADLLGGLKDNVLEIKRKADDTGTLFDGIDAKELAELIKEKMKTEIPAEIIELEKPIKKTGLHEIPVKDVVLKIEVVAI